MSAMVRLHADDQGGGVMVERIVSRTDGMPLVSVLVEDGEDSFMSALLTLKVARELHADLGELLK